MCTQPVDLICFLYFSQGYGVFDPVFLKVCVLVVFHTTSLLFRKQIAKSTSPKRVFSSSDYNLRHFHCFHGDSQSFFSTSQTFRF